MFVRVCVRVYVYVFVCVYVCVFFVCLFSSYPAVALFCCCCCCCKSTVAIPGYGKSALVVAAKIPAPNSYTIHRDEEREHPWASIKSRTKVPYPAIEHSAFGEPRGGQNTSPALTGPVSANRTPTSS